MNPLTRLQCVCLSFQDLRIGDVTQLMDLYKQMVPVGLKAAWLSKQGSVSMPLHRACSSALITGRFGHFEIEDLRLMDVPELHKDFRALLSLQP